MHTTPSRVFHSTSTVDTTSESTHRKPRLWHEFPRLYVTLGALLSLLVFRFARNNIADPDLWWHLRNAQYLLSTGHFPLRDTYSFTAAGSAWVPHEWLSEIPYYLAFRMAGLDGVFLLSLVLAEAVVLGTFYLAYRASNDIKNSFIVTAAAVPLMAVSIAPRTLLFGWVYLVILLVFLQRIKNGERLYCFLLPPLFCLWINSHASWLIGMAVFGIVAASGMVEGEWGLIYSGKWPAGQKRSLLVSGVLSVGALFINPTTYKAVLWPLGIFHPKSNSVAINYISELSSLDFHSLLGKVFLLFLLATFAASLFTARRWELETLGLLALALYGALTYARLVFLAAIVLTPILASRLRLLPPYERHKDKIWLNATILLLVGSVFVFAWPTERVLQEKVSETFPVSAVDYLKAHGTRGRLFNEYMWGGYMIWSDPELPVFIDGRGDIFDANGVFNDYADAAALQNTFRIFDKYRINYVLMPPDSPVCRLLNGAPGWKLEYSDKVSNLYLREHS